MWLITPNEGFYSVVEHPQDPDRVVIRGRVLEDLQRLKTLMPAATDPYELERATDYPWRLDASKAEWALALARMAYAIDYGNVKSAVTDRQGPARASIYSRVWMVLRALTPPRPAGDSPALVPDDTSWMPPCALCGAGRGEPCRPGCEPGTDPHLTLPLEGTR